MQETNLEHLYEELISVYHNLKAEIIVSQVKKKLGDNAKFLINNKSSFSRAYRRDVIKIDRKDDNQLFILNLSRNGLYDSLPEALFHNEKKLNKNSTFADQKKRYKEEERDARSFFSPFENEFFNQRLNIEENETNLLSNLYDLEDDFLIKFWKIDNDIPKEYKLKLIKLLPHSVVLSGDLELTRLSLERILKQKIVFNIKYKTDVTINDDSLTENKMDRLGVDFITRSKQTNVVYPFLEVSIGPLKNNEMEEFVNNIGVQKFLNAFYSYFMPMELDVTTSFTVNNNKNFILNEYQTSIMGVSTTI